MSFFLSLSQSFFCSTSLSLFLCFARTVLLIWCLCVYVSCLTQKSCSSHSLVAMNASSMATSRSSQRSLPSSDGQWLICGSLSSLSSAVLLLPNVLFLIAIQYVAVFLWKYFALGTLCFWKFVERKIIQVFSLTQCPWSLAGASCFLPWCQTLCARLFKCFEQWGSFTVFTSKYVG